MGWKQTTMQVINKTTKHGKIKNHHPASKMTSAREVGVLH
jgi:hypothetical protein